MALQQPGNGAQAKPPRRRLRLLAKIVMALLCLNLLTVGAGLLFLRSPQSGAYLGQWLSSIVNSLDCGIGLQVASLEIRWPLAIEAKNIQLRDYQGEWLQVSRLQLRLSPRSLLPNSTGHWQLHVPTAIVQGGIFSRVPQFDATLQQEAEPPSPPGPLLLMPSWLGVQADSLYIENLLLGEPLWPLGALITAPDQTLESTDNKAAVTVRLRAHGLLEATHGNIEANTEARPLPPTDPQGVLRMHLKGTWAENRLKVQANLRDTAVLSPHLEPLLPQAAALTRFAAQSAAPSSASTTAPPPAGYAEPTKANPDLASAPSGLHLMADMEVHVPLLPPTPQAPLEASWHIGVTMEGNSPAQDSPSEVNTAQHAALTGSLNFDGQTLHWDKVTATLPPVTPLISLQSQGSFNIYSGPIGEVTARLSDVGLLTALGLNMQKTPAGSVSTTLRVGNTPFVQWDVESPQLILPGGSVEKLQLRFTAQLPSSSNTTDPQSLWQPPAALEGTLALTAQSCMNFGPASLNTSWSLAHLPWAGTASTPLSLRISDLQAQLQGLRLSGKLQTQGTQLVDAGVDLTVSDTTALARLGNIPLKGGAFSLKGGVSPANKNAEGQPVFNARLHLGTGSVGALQWLSGEGQVQADRQNASLALAIKGQFSCRLRASYNFIKQQLRIDSLEVGESAKKLGAQLQSPTELTFAKGINISPLHVLLRPTGSAQVQGRLLPDSLHVDASLADIPLSLARLFTDYPVPTGTVAAKATLRGSPASPTGTVQVQVTDLPLPSQLSPPVPVALLLDGKLERGGQGSSHKLNVTARLTGMDSLDNGIITAHIPLRFAPAPALVMDAPLRAAVNWQGQLAPLWRLVPLPGLTLSGQAQVQATVSGSMRAPQAQGQVFLAKGNFVDSINGLLLRDINVEARYHSKNPSLLRISATDGRGGKVALNGQLTGDMIALRGALYKLRPLRRDDISVQLSGTLEVNGPVTAPLVAGNICIDQGLVQLLNGFGGSSVKSLKIENKNSAATARTTVSPLPDTPAQVPQCNISVTAPGRLYIRGKGIDSEWKANLRISGPLDDPRILGEVTPLRGQLDLLGHQFTIANGNISFTGASPINPSLDLTLQYKSADITALIGFHGTAKNPRMKLSSQPVLPNDEIIAQILFGKSINSLSRFEALQAANTARQLVDFGPSALDLMATTRDLLGLEVLRLGSAEAPRQSRAPRDASMQGTTSAESGDQAPTIEAGKYILDNVYVGVDQGTSDATGTTVRVEIELLPNLSLEGKTSNESTGIGINWKRDY